MVSILDCLIYIVPQVLDVLVFSNSFFSLCLHLYIFFSSVIKSTAFLLCAHSVIPSIQGHLNFRCCFSDFLSGSDSEESACSVEDQTQGLIPGLERSCGEGNGYPLWYSDLVNPMDRGAWEPTVCGVAKNRT